MDMTLHHCTFAGCWRTSEQPSLDGWTGFDDLAPGVPDGWYCREHVAALEALLVAGKLDDLDDDDDDGA